MNKEIDFLDKTLKEFGSFNNVDKDTQKKVIKAVRKLIKQGVL